MLVQVIGIIIITKSLFLLFRQKQALALMADYRKDMTLIITTGFIAFMIGTAILVFHPFWRTDKEIVTGIVGLLVAFKGLMAIFYPEALADLTGKMANRETLVGSALAGLVVGSFLAFNCF